MPDRYSTLLCLALALPTLTQPVMADTVSRILPGAEKRGQATFRWLGISLYQASLYTPAGQSFGWKRKLALKLDYARGFDKADLLDGTMSELKRIEGARTDHGALKQKLSPCFSDVREGDSFVASSTRSSRVSLWLNGKKTCTVTHPDIKKRFLGIWLSSKSRSPGLSRRLKGQ